MDNLSPIDEARSIAHRSQAPQTERTGAIAVTQDGSRFPGVAIHLKAAAGLSACAEEVAICTARGATDSSIEQIALWVPELAGDHPCGKCLQLWRELAPEAGFFLQRGDAEPQELDLHRLLPDAFVQFKRPS